MPLAFSYLVISYETEYEQLYLGVYEELTHATPHGNILSLESQ